MFEKKAEEVCSKYFEENCHKNNKWADTHDLIAMWQDGYNKANEWHYVKDGDLPKEFDKPYLCYLNGYFEVGYFMAYKEQPWHFDNYYLDNEDVDAWKEIVLPELKEIKATSTCKEML